MPQDTPWSIVAVVDDDASVLRSLEYLLESADYAVRLFTSGSDLLDSGCLSTIDCLISDIDLPGMDGVELLRQVQAQSPGLPVILISGHYDALSRLPDLCATSHAFFAKPLRGAELLEAIGSALMRSSAKKP